MENKKIIIITGIVLLIVIAAALLLRSSRQPAEYEYYTEEPETWVEGQRFTEPPNDVRINVFKATGGESTFSINKQDFPGEDKAFFVQGLYKGKYFGTVYYDNETKEKIIEISQSLDPDDGAADIFILAKSDGPGFVFYIFVDEDWRNSVSFTNIIYGMDFNNDATLIEREFNFTELSTGIYMDKLDDYNGWYDQSPVTGGIMVGEMNIEDLKKTNVTSTLVLLR